MKFLYFLVSILISTAVCAQVEIDQAIELTGSDGDRAVRNLEAPVDGTDAVNKDYVDNAVSGSGGGAARPTMLSDESATTMNRGQATRYCKALTEGDFEDWYLPTYPELMYVLSKGGIAVTNDESANLIWVADHPIGYTATSTSSQLYSFSAYRLSNGTFQLTGFTSATSHYARCVR
jgi:hypothetical protein